MPLHPQCFCVFRDGRRPFCVFCGKVRGANGRDKRVPPALYPDRPSPARQAGAGCLRFWRIAS